MLVRGKSVTLSVILAMLLALAWGTGPDPFRAQAPPEGQTLPAGLSGPTNNPGYSPQPSKVTVTGSVQAKPGLPTIDKAGEGAATVPAVTGGATNNQQKTSGLDSPGALGNAA